MLSSSFLSTPSAPSTFSIQTTYREEEVSGQNGPNDLWKREDERLIDLKETKLWPIRTSDWPHGLKVIYKKQNFSRWYNPLISILIFNLRMISFLNNIRSSRT